MPDGQCRSPSGIDIGLLFMGPQVRGPFMSPPSSRFTVLDYPAAATMASYSLAILGGCYSPFE